MPFNENVFKKSAIGFKNYGNVSNYLLSEENRVKGAIITSQGSGNGKRRVKPDDTLRAEIIRLLGKFLSKAKVIQVQSEYDKELDQTISSMKKAAEEIDPGCNLSYGRCQKIINIYIKYYVVLAYIEPNFSEYQNLLHFAHIPVDGKVIKWFLKSENTPDVEKRKVIEEIGSWKWNLDKDHYYFLQNLARNICEEHNVSYPLELEMTVIWTV